MTAKTIPDTHTRCGKRQGSKINAKTVPLLGAHRVKTRRPTKFHLLLILWKIEARCLEVAAVSVFVGPDCEAQRERMAAM